MTESHVARRHDPGDGPGGARRVAGLLTERVAPGGECGANAPLKVGCPVAGTAAAADSIEDMGLLRHEAMDVLFGDVRAPSTLGSYLRSHTWGTCRYGIAATAGELPAAPV